MVAKVYTVKSASISMTAPSLVEAASLARDLSRDLSTVEVRTNKVPWAVQVFRAGCEVYPAGTGGQGKAPRTPARVGTWVNLGHVVRCDCAECL